jgi:diketogulonate reductase-like aldo/keto reductase
LHTDYLDSYVLHGPYQRQGLGAADWEVWAAIEGLYQSGKTKMIGISNVTPEQLTQLCAKAAVKPMMVQNRCYAALGWDKEVREICRTQGIIYQGFSLLTANREVFSDPNIRVIAQRLKTGFAQVVFRFAMQVGMLPLTGTTNEQHMKDDLQAEQLILTAEDMQVIETIGI